MNPMPAVVNNAADVPLGARRVAYRYQWGSCRACGGRRGRGKVAVSYATLTQPLQLPPENWYYGTATTHNNRPATETQVYPSAPHVCRFSDY